MRNYVKYQLVRFSGWLGIIVGTKVYINFAKKSFDAAYTETLAELEALNSRAPKQPTVSPPKRGTRVHAVHAC